MIRCFFQKNSSRITSVLCTAGFLIFCGIVLYSYVTVPYTGDVQVFFAAANQAKYQQSVGIMAIFDAWELKGIGNRILMWIVYFFADTAVGFENKLAFTYVSKLVYAVFVVGVLVATAYLWPTKDAKHKRYAFFSMFLSVFAAFTSVQLQAEMTCVILSLFCLACVLHGRKWSLIVAGVVAATLMFYKSIFILLFLVILAGAMVYDDRGGANKKNYILTACVMAISEVVFVGLIRLVYPQEFADMRIAAEFQSTMLSEGSAVQLPHIVDTFINNFTQSSMAIPFLFIGVVSTILLTFFFVKAKEYARVGFLLVLWLIPIDLILVSNQYFQYHYYLLVLPGMISVVTLLKYQNISFKMVLAASILALTAVYANRILNIVNASTVLLMLIHLLILSVVVGFTREKTVIRPLFQMVTLAVCLFFWINYSSFVSQKHENLVQLQNQAVEVCDNTVPEDFGDEPVLFLDGGTAPFYSDAPSYSRYFFNLPMQRWRAELEWEIQAAEYDKLMEYDGKYIVYSDWFGTNKYPELKTKLSSEYEVLQDGGLYLHSPDWDLFQTIDVPSAEEIRDNAGCCILVRKSLQAAQSDK